MRSRDAFSTETSLTAYDDQTTSPLAQSRIATSIVERSSTAYERSTIRVTMLSISDDSASARKPT